MSRTSSSSGNRKGVKASSSWWPVRRRRRAARDQSVGIAEFGEQGPAHAAPSSAQSCASRASTRPEPARTKHRNKKANKPSGPNRNAQSQKVGWNSRHSATAVAVRERVPDDQDALQPHADIDRDRDQRRPPRCCVGRAGTTAPAAARSCRRAWSSRAARRRR